MDNLIGCNIMAHLTHNNVQVVGLLIKVDEENIYLQEKTNTTHIIPKKNIVYYTTDKLLPSKLVLTHPEVEAQAQYNSSIKVFINGEFFIEIPTPPTLDLSTANERVLKAVWGSPDVQSVLRGKIQKTIEYSPGEMNIIVADENTQNNDTDKDNSFSIGANPMNAYLSPSEMVSKLNNLMKKGK